MPNCIRVLMCNQPNGSQTPAQTFAWEKLLTIYQKNHSFMYQLLENNFGFSVLFGSFKLMDAGNGTSVVNWSRECETTEAVPIDIAVPLINEMYVATVKLVEKIYLESVEAAVADLVQIVATATAVIVAT
ncbi:unnamed protein product [Calypogeia fissa]